jgi:threonine/homoserine/homoserine lactone efflux protein
VLDAFTSVPVLFGALLGISLAAPLGPVNALMATRAARHGYWPGASVGVGATSADGILCVLVGFGVVHLLAAYPTANAVIAVAGAGLMLFFAWGAFRSARSASMDVGSSSESTPRASGGLIAGFTLALTSPYGIAWWLGVGTQLFQDLGVTVFIGFFAGVLAWVLAFTAVIVWARSRVRGLVTGVSYASAFLLTTFAVVFLWKAVDLLAAGV